MVLAGNGNWFNPRTHNCVGSVRSREENMKEREKEEKEG
jgi:hypothetical protein